MDVVQRFQPQGGQGPYGLYLYGLTTEYAYPLIEAMGIGNQLTYADHNTKQLSVTSESWRHIFTYVQQAMQSTSIYKSEASTKISDPIAASPFIMGQAAITLDGYNLLEDLSTAVSRVEGYQPFEWGVIPLPSDTSTVKHAMPVDLQEIYCINTDSKNTAAAWEIIKYVNSDDWAKSKISKGSELLSRTSVQPGTEELRMDTFHADEYIATPLHDLGYLPYQAVQKIQKILSDAVIRSQFQPDQLEQQLQWVEEQGNIILEEGR